MPRKTIDWVSVGKAAMALTVGVICVVMSGIMLWTKTGMFFGYRAYDPKQFVLQSILPCAVGAFAVVYLLKDGKSAQLNFKFIELSFKGKGGAVVLWIGAFVALMGVVIIASKMAI